MSRASTRSLVQQQPRLLPASNRAWGWLALAWLAVACSTVRTQERPPVPEITPDGSSLLAARAGWVAARQPDTPPAVWLDAGRRLEELGQEELALELYDESLARYPRHPQLLERAATMAERKDHPKQALAWLKALREQRPDDPELALRLVVTHARAGQDTAARQQLTRLLGEGRCTPARGQLMGSWVALYSGQLRLAEALAQLARLGGELDADWPLAILEGRAGRPGAAARRLRGLLERTPADLSARLLLGQLLLADGQPEEAARELELVLAQRPLHRQALLWTAAARLAADQAEAAARLLRVALAAEEPAAHLPLGLLATGDTTADHLLRSGHLRSYLQAFPAAPADHPARRRLERLQEGGP